MPVASTSRRPLTLLATAAARHWRVTLALWILLIVSGGYAYLNGLGREGFPPINTPIALVNAPYFAEDPAIVDADVANPLGEAILETEGVKSVQSFANANAVTLVVEFESDYTSAQGIAAIEGIEEGVVPDAVSVEYTELDAAAFLNQFDLLVSVLATSDASIEELEAEAARVAEQLVADPAIALAEVQEQITEALDPATGEPVRRQTTFSRVYDAGDDGFSPSVLIGIDRSPAAGLDTLGLSDTVSVLLVEADVSPGFEARITSDFAKDIRYQLSSLQSNLLTGLLAVAFVSLLLIGWRTALITAAFMITVLAATLLSLLLIGQSLNTITLFALILVLGLLVDDAVVIAESIDASRDEADTPLGVVRVAMDRVAVASFSGTLTTVLVFVPILFVSGILGEFLRAMPITVIVALLLSFFLSITVISALGARFLLRGEPSRSPIVRAQRRMAAGLRDAVMLIERRRSAGLVVGAASILFSFAVIGAAIAVAGGLSFNIFPPAKDANAMLVSADFGPGRELDEALGLADEIDAVVLDELGDDVVRGTYFFSGAGGASLWVDLTSFRDRDVTATQFADAIEDRFADDPDIELTARQIDAGPPAQEYPFALQIDADEDPVAAEELAREIVEVLPGTTITRSNGSEATITDAVLATDGQVSRTDGEHLIEVRAQFDADDLTALLEAAEEEVAELYPPAELEARGLPADAFRHDYGQESDNQEGFASAGVAMQIALIAMLILLIIQFRSIVQPVLIMLAIPFGLFGVFLSLRMSDNALSFFVMIGLIGLIGVVVNNTILLTDAANQAWRGGASNTAAIAEAVQRRFRPLVATTATTVVGLAPLALSEPFWEPMAFTLMFGLISSTVLVLVAFPFYYLLLVPPGRWIFARVASKVRRQPARP